MKPKHRLSITLQSGKTAYKKKKRYCTFFLRKIAKIKSIVKCIDYEIQGKPRFTPSPRGLSALHCIMNNHSKINQVLNYQVCRPYIWNISIPKYRFLHHSTMSSVKLSHQPQITFLVVFFSFFILLFLLQTSQLALFEHAFLWFPFPLCVSKLFKG